MSTDTLEQRFRQGKTPSGVDGFFKGKLLSILPHTPLEYTAALLSSVIVPWRGKFFGHKHEKGDNILPLYTKTFLKLYPQKIWIGDAEYGGLHAFPFTTSNQKNLANSNTVLRLSYDLAENPPRIRKIIDEVVVQDDSTLLGKAYLIEKRVPRLFAFFLLYQ